MDNTDALKQTNIPLPNPHNVIAADNNHTTQRPYILANIGNITNKPILEYMVTVSDIETDRKWLSDHPSALQPSERIYVEDSDPGSAILPAQNEPSHIIMQRMEAAKDYLKEKTGLTMPTKPTALFIAAAIGDFRAVEELISSCDVNEGDEEYHMTPLCIACACGHIDIAKRLLISFANPGIGYCNVGPDSYIHNEDNYRSYTPLHFAAWCGHPDIVRFLLEGSPGLEKRPAPDFSKVQHFAARGGSVEIIKYLEEKGINLNECINYYLTPAHLAAKAGHIDALRCLHECGAHLNHIDLKGNTPLFYAGAKAHTDVVKYLIPIALSDSDPAPPWVLYPSTPSYLSDKHLDRSFWAMRYAACDPIVLTHCLDKITNLEQRDRFGRTLLHHAVLASKVESVRAMINAGVELSPVDDCKKTPLQWARTSNKPEHQEIITLLDTG